MSIRTAKEIVCDRCATTERLDAATLTEEWPLLAQAGWTRKTGKHLCPSCSPAKPKKPRHPVEFDNAELGDEA